MYTHVYCVSAYIHICVYVLMPAALRALSMPISAKDILPAFQVDVTALEYYLPEAKAIQTSLGRTSSRGSRPPSPSLPQSTTASFLRGQPTSGVVRIESPAVSQV